MPVKDIHNFLGKFSGREPSAGGGVAGAYVASLSEPLSLENTLWCNTVVASSTVVGTQRLPFGRMRIPAPDPG